jgi:hypothetical protein
MNYQDLNGILGYSNHIRLALSTANLFPSFLSESVMILQTIRTGPLFLLTDRSCYHLCKSFFTAGLQVLLLNRMLPRS